jgi:hypothetical protein
MQFSFKILLKKRLNSIFITSKEFLLIILVREWKKILGFFNVFGVYIRGIFRQ